MIPVYEIGAQKLVPNSSESKLITLANKDKNARATVTYFVSTNSTVYVSDLRFSWNKIVFAKSCFEVLKIIIFSTFKI